MTTVSTGAAGVRPAERKPSRGGVANCAQMPAWPATRLLPVCAVGGCSGLGGRQGMLAQFPPPLPPPCWTHDAERSLTVWYSLFQLAVVRGRTGWATFG